ncbi:hypothetical protein IJH89_01145 [Candidatus Saccharibacteria bacterium]|nr:hypothetical protein [Candidatus Saccharibacteria bacterium]
MRRLDGVHCYINIDNLNAIIVDEEERTGGIRHTFHALDVYFSSVERFAKSLPHPFTVEKVTGSRLHLYVDGAPNEMVSSVLDLASYAYGASLIIAKEIPKYKTLLPFEMSIGATSGKFYVTDFILDEEILETTSIGFAANYAAKIQILTPASHIGISDDMFEMLSLRQQASFEPVRNMKLSKYEKDLFYVASLGDSDSLLRQLSDVEIRQIKERAEKVNLSEIARRKLTENSDFDMLTRNSYGKFLGIPVYADIRGFTEKFNKDDSNLEEMAARTQTVLETMYRTTTDNNGKHVQFQGDREVALFFDIKSAVISAMRQIDAVKNLGMHIGIGQDYGNVFIVKLGMRGEKDFLLLGETAVDADKLEDGHAAEDQIAISEEAYAKLLAEDKFLADLFSREKDRHTNKVAYVTKVGYLEYQNKFMSVQANKDSSEGCYNPAWGRD